MPDFARKSERAGDALALPTEKARSGGQMLRTLKSVNQTEGRSSERQGEIDGLEGAGRGPSQTNTLASQNGLWRTRLNC